MTGQTIGVIVEGHGEVIAAPILLRRIAFYFGTYDINILKPFRIPRSKFNDKFNDFERAATFLAYQSDAIVAILDADDDLPCELGPGLLARAKVRAGNLPVSVVVANREFEAWLLASIDCLRGSCGVSPDASCPQNLEDIRGAKEKLESMMEHGVYSETVDQQKLAANLDIQTAQANSRSFDKLLRDTAAILGISL